MTTSSAAYDAGGDPPEQGSDDRPGGNRMGVAEPSGTLNRSEA